MELKLLKTIGEMLLFVVSVYLGVACLYRQVLQLDQSGVGISHPFLDTLRLSFHPRLGDYLVGILEAVLLAPRGIGRWRPFADRCRGASEDEAYIKLRMLFLDEQVLLTILYVEDTLTLDYDTVREVEVGSVGSLARGDGVFDLLGFVLKGDLAIL